MTIILIEGVCAAYSSAVLIRWVVIDDFFYAYHAALMLGCFIIELSILAASMGGDLIGSFCRRSLSAIGRALRANAGGSLHSYGFKRAQ